MLYRFTRVIVFASCLWMPGLVARAQPPDLVPAESHPAPAAEPELEAAGHLRLIGSPGMLHYVASKVHEQVVMGGAEWQRGDGWLLGGAFFRNSFGQPSTFFYLGERYLNFSSHQELFAQWSAGVLYGYKAPYADKVPLNHEGFSPGLVLSLGWQFTPQLSMQLNLVGTAGIMVQFSADIR